MSILYTFRSFIADIRQRLLNQTYIVGGRRIQYCVIASPAWLHDLADRVS